MILVLLGTFVTEFNRPLLEIERLCAEGIIAEEVVVQGGYTTMPESKYMSITPFFSPDELTVLHKQARLVITHAGVGSIMKALQLKKKVVAVARLAKYNEHVDDHQVEVLEEFAKLRYLLPWRDTGSLKTILSEINSFTPQEYISNKYQLIEYLTDYIDCL